MVSPSPDVEVEVAVVGGGMVGACAALGLAQAGHDVLLVDAAEPLPVAAHRGLLGIDIRNVALSPASGRLLDSVGAWQGLEMVRYERMHVWEQWGTAALDFTAAEVDRDELGWVVEASRAVALLWAQLRLHPRVTVRANTPLEGVITADPNDDPGYVELVASAGERIRAGFVIACDGARSVVRTSLAVPVTTLATDQLALATVVTSDKSHMHTCWQRFLLDGPLALLPSIDEHTSSVVWSQSPEQAERRLALSDAEFCRELTHASERVIGTITAVDRRVAFPIQQQCAEQFLPHKRVVLAGDAARSVHPLAGLGVNLGFEDVTALLGITSRVTDLAAANWRQFARERQARSQTMMRAMDAFRRVYGEGTPLAQLVRNTSVRLLAGASRVPGVGLAAQAAKRQLMFSALGL